MNKFIRNFFALFLIAIGLLFLLGNLQIIDSTFKEIWHYIYPIFFIVLGIVLIFRSLFDKRRGWMLGSFLLIFGSLLILGRVNLLDFTIQDMLELWPLLIIYAGILLISTGRTKNMNHSLSSFKKKDLDDKTFQNFTVGTFTYEKSGWVVEPIEIRRVVGDFYFDFTKANIPEGKTPIFIDSWAGTIRMRMPENCAFHIDAKVAAGEIHILEQKVDGMNRKMSFKTENYEEATKKLNIKVNLKAGSFRVQREKEE